MKLKRNLVGKKLAKFPNVLAVITFGSSVRGNTGKLSDVDIGIVFENPEAVLKKAETRLELYEKLFDVFASLVKNTDKLDLVFLQRTPLTLQKEAVLEGKLLYCQNPKQFLDYKENILNKYLDIKPLYDQFYKDIFATRL